MRKRKSACVCVRGLSVARLESHMCKRHVTHTCDMSLPYHMRHVTQANECDIGITWSRYIGCLARGNDLSLLYVHCCHTRVCTRVLVRSLAHSLSRARARGVSFAISCFVTHIHIVTRARTHTHTYRVRRNETTQRC